MAIIGIAIFTSLGTWQVNRAKEKQILQDKVESQQSKPAFRLNESIDDIADKIYMPVKAAGKYDPENEILIDNQINNGQAGYHVLTPFVLSDNNSVILVNRGWIPLGKSRDILPELTSPAGEIVIEGKLAKHKSKPALVLDNAINIENKVWMFYDEQLYAAKTGFTLLPAVILLKEDAPDGYFREWPKYDANVTMHIGYAVQWYVFAAIVLITYIGVNLKKKEQDNAASNE